MQKISISPTPNCKAIPTAFVASEANTLFTLDSYSNTIAINIV